MASRDPAVTTETEICNMALGLIGSKRLTALAADNSVEAIHCRLHYYQARDVLLRSHIWSFAITRKTLSEHFTPSSEFGYGFVLPDDFLRMKEGYDLAINDSKPFFIESNSTGKLSILTDDRTVSLVYIRQVTDVAQFDPLFVDLLVYTLAMRLLFPLAGTSATSLSMRKILLEELERLWRRYRAVNRQEQTDTGKSYWNDAREAEG